ncbi:MAG: ABC transporter permease subunit [Sphingomonadales bacterium]|nr:ABC transporter permease subunit [Sphingomonadales bacterium]
MNWGDAFARMPPLLADHILLAATAMLLGLIIAVPTGIFAVRHPRFGKAALAFASLIQTIPSLALLALFYPLLLGLQTVIAVPALGFLPSLLALALYALLPILRNIVIGLEGIDPDVIEAADGLGMTRWQKLTIVEAPIALPAIMGGIRTAAVWTIGAATLSTTVGQNSLGNLIFSGLQLQNWTLVLTGCLTAAALAIIVDSLLALSEWGLKRRILLSWFLPSLLLILVPLSIALWPAPDKDRLITIGAKGFSEQFILAQLIGSRLEKAGYHVEYKSNLGSAVVFEALTANDVDVYVDYSGTLWTNAMKRSDKLSKAAMREEVARWAKAQHSVTSLGSLGFENSYAMAVSGDLARRLNLKNIADLSREAPSLTLGSDVEFLDRPEWAALRDAYGLRFRQSKSFNPTFMYDAIRSGDADVISAFSSDGRIAAYGMTVLTDTKGAIPGYDALLLIGPRAGKDAKLIQALRPLAGAIPVEKMRRANMMVDGDEKTSAADAAKWLDAEIR